MSNFKTTQPDKTINRYTSTLSLFIAIDIERTTVTIIELVQVRCAFFLKFVLSFSLTKGGVCCLICLCVCTYLVRSFVSSVEGGKEGGCGSSTVARAGALATHTPSIN